MRFTIEIIQSNENYSIIINESRFSNDALQIINTHKNDLDYKW